MLKAEEVENITFPLSPVKQLWGWRGSLERTGPSLTTTTPNLFTEDTSGEKTRKSHCASCLFIHTSFSNSKLETFQRNKPVLCFPLLKFVKLKSPYTLPMNNTLFNQIQF